MPKQLHIFLSVVLIVICVGTASGQETFKNPALETDEAERVISSGRLLARKGQPEDAIKEFKKAAALKNGDCAECFQLIGQTYFFMSDYKESAAAFKQAIALKSPNEAGLYNSLGVALYLQEEKKLLPEAVEAFKRALALSENKIVKAYYNLGYALIEMGKNEEGVAALKTYLDLNPDASEASAVRAVIADPTLVKAKFAPDFKVVSSTGEAMSLEKYRGKVVLLDFWATWCGPCRVEMPDVKRLWKKFGGDNFVIIGINMDSSESAFNSYVKQEELTWPQYYDGLAWKNKIAQLYNVNSIPHTVLIDQNGVIHALGVRAGSLSGKIEKLLKNVNRKP